MYQYLYIDLMFFFLISMITYVGYKQKNYMLLLGLALVFVLIMTMKTGLHSWAIYNGKSTCDFMDDFLECNK